MERHQTSLLLLAAIVASVAVGCERRTFPSGSMAPTIAAGEAVTIDHSAYAFSSPKRWDVVAFHPPGRTNQIWLMRIVGLPGERVGFASGGITLDGQPLVLPPHLSKLTYFSLDRIDLPSRIASPYTVPQGSYFVLGDNSGSANDSRAWGAVPETNILGKVRGK